MNTNYNETVYFLIEAKDWSEEYSFDLEYSYADSSYMAVAEESLEAEDDHAILSVNELESKYNVETSDLRDFYVNNKRLAKWSNPYPYGPAMVSFLEKFNINISE